MGSWMRGAWGPEDPRIAHDAKNIELVQYIELVQCCSSESSMRGERNFKGKTLDT